MLRSFLFVLLACVAAPAGQAQDFQFGQFWNAPQAQNPAFTSLHHNLYSNFQVQSQHSVFRHVRDWSSSHQASFGINFPVFRQDYIAFGYQGLYMGNWERIKMTNTQQRLSLAFIKKISKRHQKDHYLSFGGSMYYGDYNACFFGYCTLFGFEEPIPMRTLRFNPVDADLGLAWHFVPKVIRNQETSHYTLGLSLHHIVQQPNQFSFPENVRPFPRWQLNFNSLTPLNRKLSLEGHLLANLQRPFNWNFPMRFSMGRIHAATNFRYSPQPHRSPQFILGGGVQYYYNFFAWNRIGYLANFGADFDGIQFNISYNSYLNSGYLADMEHVISVGFQYAHFARCRFPIKAATF